MKGYYLFPIIPKHPVLPVKCLVTFLSGVEHKRYQIETNTQAANGQHQNSLHKKLEKVIIFMFAQIIELIIECC